MRRIHITVRAWAEMWGADEFQRQVLPKGTPVCGDENWRLGDRAIAETEIDRATVPTCPTCAVMADYAREGCP